MLKIELTLRKNVYKYYYIKTHLVFCNTNSNIVKHLQQRSFCKKTNCDLKCLFKVNWRSKCISLVTIKMLNSKK